MVRMAGQANMFRGHMKDEHDGALAGTVME